MRARAGRVRGEEEGRLSLPVLPEAGRCISLWPQSLPGGRGAMRGRGGSSFGSVILAEYPIIGYAKRLVTKSKEKQNRDPLAV